MATTYICDNCEDSIEGQPNALKIKMSNTEVKHRHLCDDCFSDLMEDAIFSKITLSDD